MREGSSLVPRFVHTVDRTAPGSRRGNDTHPGAVPVRWRFPNRLRSHRSATRAAQSRFPQTGQGERPRCAYSRRARLVCSALEARAGSPEPPTLRHVPTSNWYSPRYLPELDTARGLSVDSHSASACQSSAGVTGRVRVACVGITRRGEGATETG